MYGLVCFTLEPVIPEDVRVAMAKVNVELVTLAPFEPKPPATQRTFARLPDNWKISFDRLTMFGQEEAYDLLVYMDADTVIVDNIDELLDLSGFDVVLTPELDPCEHAAPQGVNAGVLVFRPSKYFLSAIQDFSRDMIAQQDWTPFRVSDQSLLAWFLRRYYPGPRAFAAAGAAVPNPQKLVPRTSRLGKERTLFASATYNMPIGSCACNVTAPATFDHDIFPFVKVWHFTTDKPYHWSADKSISPYLHCFCPLMAQFQRWMEAARTCSGNLLETTMQGPRKVPTAVKTTTTTTKGAGG